MGKSSALVLVLLSSMALCVASFMPVWAVSDDSWTTRASMHYPRAYLGVAVVNGKIYAIGGDTAFISGGAAYPGIISGSPVSSTNEKYDPLTDKWTTMTPMPTARAQFGIAVCQNKIYCIGGYNSSIINMDSNEVYDPAVDSWSTKTPMPAPASHISANTVNNKIYVIRNDCPARLNYVYDPLTDSWDSKAPPPNEISERYTTVVGDKIYCIGYIENYTNVIPIGYIRSYINVIQTYDTSNDTWSILTTAPSYVYAENGCGVTSGKYAPEQIYYFEDKATYILNLSNNSWTTGTAMPSNRLCAAVAVINDTFYVVGGRSGPHGVVTIMNPSAVTERYIPFGYQTDFTPPKITLESPQNTTYFGSDVSLNFDVDEAVSWMGYSLDEQDNSTIAGNLTLAGLSEGYHRVVVYANDTAGNVGSSMTVYFNVAQPESTLTPTPTPAATTSTPKPSATPETTTSPTAISTFSPEATTSPTPTPEPTSTPETATFPIYVAVATVVILIVAVTAVALRKKQTKPQPTNSDIHGFFK